jgi:serine/threonine-protein kinase RsbW
MCQIFTEPCGADALASSSRPNHSFDARLRTTDEIAALLDAVVAAMTEDGYSSREVFGVRLSLEEALVNAIKHGHRYDPTKEVRFTCQVLADRVVSVVEDQGPGFDRDSVLDPLMDENLERPCGRGLLLMREFMTWVDYSERGNRVVLCLERNVSSHSPSAT